MRIFVLVLVVVAQFAVPSHARACEFDEFSPTGPTAILAPDDPGVPPGDCCTCDTCADGCVHATFASAASTTLVALFPAGTTPSFVFQAGFAPTDYPVDLRPPIEG